jgi:hypothetical protein
MLIVRHAGVDDRLISSLIDPGLNDLLVKECNGLDEATVYLNALCGAGKTLPDRAGLELLKRLQDFIRECNFMPRVIVIGSRLDDLAVQAALTYPCVRSVVRKPDPRVLSTS